MVRLVAAETSLVVLLCSSVQAFILPNPPPSTGSRAETICSATTTEISRLDFLRSTGGALTVAAGAPLLPKASNAEVFTDDVLGFKMDVPDGWERKDAEISGRRKLIVYTSPKTPGTNAFVAYTPARGDFTTLGSFGTLDEVSKTVLPEAEGVSSRMVNSYTSKNSYVYDYIVNQQGRPEKHIKTIWILFPDQGQLATITAQCNESDYPAMGKSIDDLIASVTKT
eukprot:g18006.t1